MAPAIGGPGRHHGHQLGVEHRRLVDDDDGFLRPARAAVVEREELAMDRAGMAEAVGAHILRDGIGRRQPDHAVAGAFIGLADRRDRVALAGAGLAVDEGEALGAGRVAEGARLLRRDAGEFRVVEDDGLDEIGDAMAGAGGEFDGRAQDMPFGFEHGARRVARERAADFVRQFDDFRPRENLGLEFRPALLASDFLRQRALELRRREGRALPGQRLEDSRRIARGDRVAQLVHVLAARRDDPAMLELVSLRPF